MIAHMSERNTPIDHTETVRSLGSESIIQISVEPLSGTRGTTYDLSKVSDEVFGVPKVNGARAIGPPITLVPHKEEEDVTFVEGELLAFKDIKSPEKRIVLGVLTSLQVIIRTRATKP